MPDVERNWGIWWEQGSRSGWITDDGVRATYTLAEARVRVVEFRQIAIWREAGFTYRVHTLESEPTDRQRRRPLVHLSLSHEALARLDAIATERGQTRSGAVEQLVRKARLRETESR